jgi:hypothetical protein
MYIVLSSMYQAKCASLDVYFRADRMNMNLHSTYILDKISSIAVLAAADLAHLY